MLLPVEFQDANTGSKLEMKTIDYCTEYSTEHVQSKTHIHHNIWHVSVSNDNFEIGNVIVQSQQINWHLEALLSSKSTNYYQKLKGARQILKAYFPHSLFGRWCS